MSRKMLIDGEVNNSNEQEYDYDLFVIGAGSGGVRASRTSAGFGAKVAICELPFHPISSETIGGVGGTCVIRGCVPKKILVYGASFAGEFEDAQNYGWELNEKPNYNWKKLLENKTQEIVRLNGIYKRLLSNAGVTMYEGEGKVVGPHEVELTQIDGTKLNFSAKHILVATGGRAQRPNIPGKELGITSDEALSLDELPKRVVVLGGGYIAVEFASIWRGMGSAVDLFFRKELPLRGFDDEMRELVAQNLEGRGINLHPAENLTELIKTEDGIKVITDHGKELIADVVLFATGRIPNTKRLNLEAVGVELDRTGAVKVDEFSGTNIPSIWAVGDVTNRINLTPVALMEGSCFSKTVFGKEPSKPDYRDVPCAVFCIPPLSTVGLTEQQAVEQAKSDTLVFTSTFKPMKNTISGRQEKSMMKLIVDADTDKVLGASMCGPDAAEIMQGIAVALKCGATKAVFDSTVGIHPSAAEEFVTMRSIELQFFDPGNSSSASPISCIDSVCSSLVQTAEAVCLENSQCSYQFQYGDGSGTAGFYVSDMLGFDTVTGNSLMSNSSAPVVFGCSNYLSGDLTTTQRAVDGIVGFGQHGMSIIQQLSSRGITPRVFSHCLKGTGRGGGVLVLGEVVAEGIVYSPLVPSRHHYNLDLQSIALNGLLVPIDPAVFSNGQGTIVDSGTTLAHLPEEAFDPFVNALVGVVQPSVKPFVDKKGHQCFIAQTSVSEAFPPVMLNFAGGTPSEFAENLLSQGEWCVGFQKGELLGQRITILGDLVLKDKIIIYDLARQRIGWVNYDCSQSVNVTLGSGYVKISEGQLNGSRSPKDALYQLIIIPIAATAISLYISLFTRF
ncbi:hypothetical protein MKW92_024889 [Papaver armeniacum]|nr:hypothetical protein MKW92_024889 [Papaver armeniacum]